MISADVKANIKQQEIKKLVVPSKLQYNVETVCTFPLILVGFPSILILSIKDRTRVGVVGKGLLNVIWRHSLSTIC